jgi:hypothetical protein
MTFNIKNNLGSLLIVFNIVKKTYILFFFKPYICSLISIHLSHGTIADL